MNKIAVFGAGGFGREVHFLIEQINRVKPSFEFIGYFDDGIAKGKIINNYPVLGGINELNQYPDDLSLAVAVGDPVIKKKIIEKIENNRITFPTLIHPSAIIGNPEFTKLGKGCIICAGVIITVNINIGDFVILNLSCTVGHDTNIGDYSSFMPTINISGEVNIDKCVYVGTGAKIINQLTIGENAIIGAGAVIIRNVPNYATVVGNPGKIIKIAEH